MTSCAYSDIITIQWCLVYEYCNVLDASIQHKIMLKMYSSSLQHFKFNIGKLMLILSTDVQSALLSLGYMDKNYQKYFLVLSTLIRLFLFWELGTDARIIIEEVALFASSKCGEEMCWVCVLNLSVLFSAHTQLKWVLRVNLS